MLVAGCANTRGSGGPDNVEPAVSGIDGGASADVRVIATLGDSIVAGSPRWDPDQDVRASLRGVDRDSQWQRWVDSGGAVLRNCGVWGERTDEIAERFERCTDGADAVVIQGGINDVVQGRSVSEAAHDLACIAERARADGLDIAIIDVLPWNNGWPDAAPTIIELNQKIHELGTRGGVPVLPFYDTLEDDRREGRMPGTLTEDGNHPDVEGYRLLGTRAWRTPTPATAAFATDC